MTYTDPTPTIWKTRNPIHIIIKNKSTTRFMDRDLWLDLEDGSINPKIPLTKALKFNIAHYDEDGNRIQGSSFKIPSIDEIVELRNALNEVIKIWKKKIK